jgi:ubiquitin-protein ligase
VQINLPHDYPQKPPKQKVELAADEIGGELLP